MKNDTTLAGLMEQWPDLKKRTENESNTEQLILLLYDLEGFLLRLEATVVANDKERLSAGAGAHIHAVRTGIGSS